MQEEWKGPLLMQVNWKGLCSCRKTGKASAHARKLKRASLYSRKKSENGLSLLMQEEWTRPFLLTQETWKRPLLMREKRRSLLVQEKWSDPIWNTGMAVSAFRHGLHVQELWEYWTWSSKQAPRSESSHGHTAQLALQPGTPPSWPPAWPGTIDLLGLEIAHMRDRHGAQPSTQCAGLHIKPGWNHIPQALPVGADMRASLSAAPGPPYLSRAPPQAASPHQHLLQAGVRPRRPLYELTS